MEDKPDPPIRDDGLPSPYVPDDSNGFPAYTPQPALSDEEKRQLGIPLDGPAEDDAFDVESMRAIRNREDVSSASAEAPSVASAGGADASAETAGTSGEIQDLNSSLADVTAASDGVESALSDATEAIHSLTDAVKNLDISSESTDTIGHAENDSSAPLEQPTQKPEKADLPLVSPSVKSAASSAGAKKPEHDRRTPSLFDDKRWLDLWQDSDRLRREATGDKTVRPAPRQKPRTGSIDDSPLVAEEEKKASPYEQAMLRMDSRAERQEQFNNEAYKRQTRTSVLNAGREVASIASTAGGGELGPGAGMTGVAGAFAGASTAVSAGMGPAGIALSAAASGAAAGLNAVMKSASNAASSLAKYSGQMSVSNAKAHVNQIVGDVNRAQILAPGVSRYTEATSKLSEMAQNAQAAFLKAALDKIVPALEGILEAIEKYGPPMLNFFIDVMEMLDGLIQAIPDVMAGMMPIKAISSGMLDAARNLRELNDRDRKRDNKDTEMFLDQFLQAGGMGIDPDWQKPHNPPQNQHPVHQNIRQILNMPFVNGF